LAFQHDYIVCGVRGDRGVVGSLDINTFSLTNFYQTEIPWEYHKVILKKNPDGHSGIFVVSGINPNRDSIGFTTIDPLFSPINSYAWEQKTESLSHCVVGDYLGINYGIIVASSYKDMVTLSPHSISTIIGIAPISYHFGLDGAHHVQDIGTIMQDNELRISVAGFTSTDTPVQYSAWHGYVSGLSNLSTMVNNYYFDTGDEDFRHYKIGYFDGEEFAGGCFQGDIDNTYSTCALFSSPLKLNDDCHELDISEYPFVEAINKSHFYLQELNKDYQSFFYESYEGYMFANDYCGDLKGSKSPQFAMRVPEMESEIIILHDRIIVKDVPNNTLYQIYSVTGQLIQTGTTNPDISTAQLSKGMYILRLETRKAFKFVK
jgi:hypothetical protein